MENKEQLKILALRIGKTNQTSSYKFKNLNKNLQEGEAYFFYEGYEISKDGKNRLIKKGDIIPDDFFNIPTHEKKEAGKPYISISAIVGKNGSGKSALMDMVLRLINNFSYNYMPTPKPENLVYLKGVNAELYFSLGGKEIYSIRQTDNSEEKNFNASLFIDGIETTEETSRAIFKSFFYTIVINYSIYAFNTRDYPFEYVPDGNGNWHHWLDGLFHKNDGYKTPIVLNPFRDEGDIKIGTENSLTKDRMISLFLYEDNAKDKIFRRINNSNEVNFLIVAKTNTWDDLKHKIIRKCGDKGYRVIREMEDPILSAWDTLSANGKHKYSFDPAVKEEFANIAKSYLAYKTLAIAWQYNDMVFGGTIPQKIMAINPKTSKDSGANVPDEPVPMEDIFKLVSILDNDPSHITQKIRQTLAFLVCNHYNVDSRPWGSDPEDDGITNEKMSAIRKRIVSTQSHEYYKEGKLQLDTLSKRVYSNNEIQKAKKAYGWKTIDFLPAPCFHTEIFLRNTNTGDIYSFSQLSSGEKQLVYSLSTILYHIRNLDSVEPKKQRIQYKHINLILDEVELYFHPEYQRLFVYYLINSIKNMNFTNINSISIMISTHSPIMLSDIPRTNTLFLQEGHPEVSNSETFGANIHELYRNSFFIKGMPIGEFAKTKIQKLFNEANMAEGQMTSKKLLAEINLVQEPILRKQLVELYNLNRRHSCAQEARIKHLEEELASLRKGKL